MASNYIPEAVARPSPRLGKFGIAWVVVLIVVGVLSQFIGWFNDTTELTPAHDGALNLSFLVSGLAAFPSAVVAIWQSKGMSVARRSMLALVFAFEAAAVTAMTLSSAIEVVEGWIDFPPAQTRTYSALISISRAYQTHGKGRSWNIQTTPIWSNLNITRADYEFMASHRRSGDRSTDPDEISSGGYFCARVIMQQAGAAIRVLHAGTHKLPQGTVVVCPSA